MVRVLLSFHPVSRNVDHVGVVGTPPQVIVVRDLTSAAAYRHDIPYRSANRVVEPSPAIGSVWLPPCRDSSKLLDPGFGARIPDVWHLAAIQDKRALADSLRQFGCADILIVSQFQLGFAMSN
jgi:hypothetical protein